MEIIISFPFKQILHVKGDPVPFTQINELMYHFTVILWALTLLAIVKKEIHTSCILSQKIIMICLIIKSILGKYYFKLLWIFLLFLFVWGIFVCFCCCCCKLVCLFFRLIYTLLTCKKCKNKNQGLILNNLLLDFLFPGFKHFA